MSNHQCTFCPQESAYECDFCHGDLCKDCYVMKQLFHGAQRCVLCRAWWVGGSFSPKNISFTRDKFEKN